jgi:OOP family OmpA-OmpF porin
MHRIRALTLLALASVTATGSVAAQHRGYYLGVGAGATDWGSDPTSFDDGTLTAWAIDPDDEGWKLYAGFRFSKYFGVEGGWADIGSVGFRGQSSGCVPATDCFYPAGPVSYTRSADGFFGMAVAMWPIATIDVLGKIGFLGVDLEVQPQDPAALLGSSLSKTETAWGFGLQWRLDRPIVRLEWERITHVPEDDVDFVTASLLYRFGER